MLIPIVFAAALAAAPLEPPPPAALPRRVAVLEFTASWSASCAAPAPDRTATAAEECELLKLLTEEARAAAVASLRPPDFQVMTRETVALVLESKPEKCAEADCEVATARLVGADLVITGTVASLDGAYLVSVRVHDGRSGAPLAMARFDARGRFEALRAARPEVETALSSFRGVSATPGPLASSEQPPGADFARPEGLHFEVGFRWMDSNPDGDATGGVAMSTVPGRSLTGQFDIGVRYSRFIATFMSRVLLDGRAPASGGFSTVNGPYDKSEWLAIGLQAQVELGSHPRWIPWLGVAFGKSELQYVRKPEKTDYGYTGRFYEAEVGLDYAFFRALAVGVVATYTVERFDEVVTYAADGSPVLTGIVSPMQHSWVNLGGRLRF